MHEPFSDAARQIVTMVEGNQIEHHIERTDAACRGEAGSVDDIDRPFELQVGEGFDEGRLALPMQRAGKAIEQAGSPKVEGPVSHAPDIAALAKGFADPAEWPLRLQAIRIASRTDHDVIGHRRLPDGEVRRNHDAVRGAYGPFVAAD